ncbi:hypothetical protein NDU88_010906 [Pleurodeles waltl]|uniref:Uncharacterized protein n=1 Tax=Pleurodeles waltl TaxID=8319 RepID=A0AAV7QX25_PLEWA|nr:hypothetical protein NDU88_010906 [Pleurodeles waltl]
MQIACTRITQRLRCGAASQRLRTRRRPRTAPGVDPGVAGGLARTACGARRCLAGPWRWDTVVRSGSCPRRASGVSGPAGLAGVLPLALDDWSAAAVARGQGLPAVLTRGRCRRNGVGWEPEGGCQSWLARWGRLRASRSDTWCAQQSTQEERHHGKEWSSDTARGTGGGA